MYMRCVDTIIRVCMCEFIVNTTKHYCKETILIGTTIDTIVYNEYMNVQCTLYM